MRSILLLIVAALSLGAVEIRLDWNTNTESDFDHYRVYRAVGTSVSATTGNRVQTNLGSSAWTDTGVAAATTYSYVVTAVDTSGNESSASNKVTVSTPAPAPRDAFARIEAEDFDASQGIGTYSGGTGQKIGSIENGTWARYDNVDFGSGTIGSIVARVASNTSGGTIEYRLGSTTGTLLGTTDVPGTGGWNTFTTITAATDASTSGTKTLFLVFTGGGGALLDVDWFHFDAGTVTPPNQAPSASFTASTSDLTASVNASGSSDPDGDSLSYSWTWGDGSSGSGQTASHSYAAAGTYSVELTVSDGDLSDTATRSVTVDDPPPPPSGIEGTWLLTNVGQSGQSLNAEGTANRANVGGEATDGSDDTQVFEVIATGGGWYKLISFASGKAVECWQSNPANGDSVSLYDDNGRDWQRWRFEAQGDGSFAIIGKYNTRPMTLEGGDVVCRSEAGLATQRWRLVDPDGSTPPPSNAAPIASFTASTNDLTASVNGSGSSDPDGDSLTYSWTWGDGGNGSGVSASHSYASAGSYTVTLTVSDGSLSDTATKTVSVSAPPTPGDLPAPWVGGDIGNVATAGSSEYVDGVFTVSGSGSDIWYDADEFHFVSQALSGDLIITARVASQTNPNAWAKAGVMIRDSLDPDAKSALMCVTAAKGTSFDWRLSTGGGTSKDYPGDGIQAPEWVRLVRSGSTITAYKSSDGSNWSQVGQRSIGFSAAVEVGLAVTAHQDGSLCTATFEEVEVLPAGGG